LRPPYTIISSFSPGHPFFRSSQGKERNLQFKSFLSSIRSWNTNSTETQQNNHRSIRSQQGLAIMPAASEAPSVPLTFANNFWGMDDAGVSPLLDRMHNAKLTCDELKAFYSMRATIEEEYARKMLSLARRPLGSGETGTLKLSLDVVRQEVETMGKEHQRVSQKMRADLEEPLNAFAGHMKERRKIVQAPIEKLLKIKAQQTVAANKVRQLPTECNANKTVSRSI
jgi:Fes/CIP4, and EFC/F-BAR homology domain